MRRDPQRRARFHLAGPAPWGGSLSTSNLAEVHRMLAIGWRIARIRLLPADGIRLACLVIQEREARDAA